MAQSVERQTVNLQVPGSKDYENPGVGEIFNALVTILC